jgi:hypothetical protein
LLLRPPDRLPSCSVVREGGRGECTFDTKQFVCSQQLWNKNHSNNSEWVQDFPFDILCNEYR